MKKGFFLGSLFSLILIISCLTINVYFPAAAVQEAANQFVEDVQGKNLGESNKPTPESAQPSPQKEGFLRNHFLRNAYAQGEEAIRINTPEANRLKSAMKRRNSTISQFKDKGAIGEDNEGLLSSRDIQNLPLPDRAKAKQTISQENSDRMNLYREILKANNYPHSKLKEIQKIFAKSWQMNARSGWWIQKEDGSWVKK